MGKQGKGRRLTDKERLEIIALTRQNPRIKHVELAAKYNVNESTIRKWRAQANAAKIEERYAQGVAASRDGRQRGQAVRNSQFDAQLYEWVTGMMKQEQDLAPARVREKARSLATEYDGMDGFKASSGWFYRFCRRYGLPCGPTAREGGGKIHDEMAIMGLIPMDNVHNTSMLAHHQTASIHTQLPSNDTSDMPTDHEDHSVDGATDAAAIAMSLQPPPTSSTQVQAGDLGPTDAKDSAPETGAGDLLLGLGEMAAMPTTTAPTADISPSTSTTTTTTEHPPQVTSTTTTTSASASVQSENASLATAVLPPGFSASQAAITHMVQHFKDVLDPPTRLRLVRHLTRVPGEAEMYLVMDDETRLEYVKEFAQAPGATTPSPPAEATTI